MLFLEAPYIVVDGLVILKDHANPEQFYYYPSAPRLALNPDGTPSFLFVQYKTGDASNFPQGSEPGGGFLNFDVDLRVDQSLLNKASNEIKRRMNLQEAPLLAPIEYRTGKTRLIFLDYQPPDNTATDAPAGTGTTPPATPGNQPALTFVEAASYAATPSLYGDNRASFSVQLTAAGATLVQDTLDAKTSLIGVVYDLTFVGLRPAYNVSLHVDWNRLYDYVESHFKAGALFFQADISSATEKLIEDQVIQINVISFGAGASDADIIADKDEAVKYVKQYITDKFFQPSINPKEALTDSWYYQLGQTVQDLAPDFCGYSSKSINRTDEKDLFINLSEESATERRIVPQGHLQGLMDVLKQYPLDAYVRKVDLNDPFFQEVKVAAVGGAAMATDHIDRIQCHFEYGPDGSSTPRDILLNTAGATDQVQWSLIEDVGFTYRYTYSVYFKPDAPPGKGDHIDSPLIATNKTKLVLDPRDLYQVQPVKIQVTNLPFDRYPQVEVELHYSDVDANLSLVQSFVITQGSQTAQWSFRASDANKLSYQYRLTYFPANGAPIQGDWKETIDPTILIDDPYNSDQLKVQIIPAVSFNNILRILVNLTYQDANHNLLKNDLKMLTQASDIVEWDVPLADRTRRQYSYQVTVQYKNGSIKELPETTSSETLLFVGDVFQHTNKVTVLASGSSFADANISKIQVALVYDDPSNQLHDSFVGILASVDDKFDWNYEIMDPTHDSYSYEVTYFGISGLQRKVPARSTNVQQLVIPVQ